MQTKLTLSIEESVIDQAKTYAKKQGTSLSKIVQEFLKQKAAEIKDEMDIPDEFKGIYGAVKLPEDFEYKEEKAEYLRKKYK